MLARSLADSIRLAGEDSPMRDPEPRDRLAGADADALRAHAESLADKIVVTAVLIMLAGVSRTPSVPAWMVVVIVARELAITGLRLLAASKTTGAR